MRDPTQSRAAASGTMHNHIRAIFFLAIVLFTIQCQGSLTAAAQSGPIDWSKPIDLSNTPQNSENPAIVADDFGYVHVFWSEDLGGDPFEYGQTSGIANSIFYMRWDGVSWTPAVDVLSVPSGEIAAFVSVDVDKDNQLHAVWTGQTNFYYSTAPSWLADSAHAWTTPFVIATGSARSSWESDIACSPSGNLHIVYATRGTDVGVYYIRSDDGGLTWESPIRLSEPFDQLERGFSNVRVYADSASRVHVVWQTSQEEGYGQAVYYARSPDDGETWDRTVRLGYRDPGDYEASYPYLASVSESEIHLVYLDGTIRGRSHRISQDGGETWSNPVQIIPEMEGVNGYVQPLVDGAGQLHLVIDMRTRIGQTVGIYYTHWLGDSWSAVVPVDTDGESASSAHYVAAAVRLGNELHIVWEQLRSAEIWYVSGTIPSISQESPLSLPMTEPLAPTALPPTPTPDVLSSPTPLPLSIQESTDPNAQPRATSSSVDALAISVVTSLLVVSGVGVWTRVRSRQRGQAPMWRARK